MPEPRTDCLPTWIQPLLGFFRIESPHLEWAQGVRAALGLSVPIGLGLLFDQLASAVVATLGVWFVLITDVGGAYRQKAIAMLSSTLGVVCAMLVASVVSVSPWLQVFGTFVWVSAAAFVGIYGNSAATVSFSTSLMFVVSAAFSHATDIWLRSFLCFIGGIWAVCLSLALWPLHAFTPVIEAVGQCYEKLADLLEAAYSLNPTDDPADVSLKDPFASRYEALITSLENARKTWTAVRVRRAGPSARSIQLLALIENAGQLCSAAVALHEQMLVVSAHPRFRDVNNELTQERIELVRTTRSIAAAITQRGGDVDLSELEEAHTSVEQAIEKLRSTTFEQVYDFSVLVHIGKLSRSIKSVLDQLRADAEVAANLRTGRLVDFVQVTSRPTWERRSTRLLAVLRNNLTFRSVTFRHAVRLGAGTAIATALADALHLPRGYWIVITVLVVLKPNFGGTIERVIQRIGGTVIGGVIALMISFLVLDQWILFFCLALLAFVSFSVRTLGYGIFTLAITPLFMVLLDLANPGDWTVSVLRIVDTLIGGALALIGGYTLFPIWEREQLPLQLARTFKSLRNYFDEVINTYLEETVPPQELEKAKRQASLEVANAATASQRLLSEPVHVRGETEPTLALVNYGRRFFLAVGALEEHVREFRGRREMAGVRAFAEAASDQLENLAEVLQTGANLQSPRDLDRYLEELRSEVERLSAARLAEFTRDLKKEVTSTVLALREQSGVHVQLKRIAEHLRVLQDAVARLKGLPRAESAAVPTET